MERNENGYSGFSSRGVSQANQRRNGTCPGTGELWRGNSEMGESRELDFVRDIDWNAARDGQNACSKHQLAMVYSPHQCWRRIYSPDEALGRGTLFEELYKPLEDCVNG